MIRRAPATCSSARTGLIPASPWIRQGLLALALLFLSSGCAALRPAAPTGTPVIRTLLTTGYCPCRTCCGWTRGFLGRPVYSSGPLKGKPKAVGVTASGKKARTGTIAADTARYPFGTRMYVPGYGYGTVEDTGGAINGEHIDLFFHTHQEALLWGRRYKSVKIWPVP